MQSSRPHLSRHCVAAFFAATLLLCPTSSALAFQASDQPNIVFLISDDHAWTDYGFMGHKQVETPNLDKLAARKAIKKMQEEYAAAHPVLKKRVSRR